MASNRDAIRPKRKQSPVSLLDRPAKQLRPDLQAPTPGDQTPKNGSIYNVEGNKEVAATAALNSLSAPDSPEWQATIEKAVKSVVSIHFCQTCSFDADLSSCGQATGFVVDAERGYIMTNRHVVSAGPFWGYCIFDNHEECDVIPVYRDPVHDFGILKFDTKAIKHMKINALDLRPDGAKIGAEIRVVGNDAGEKLSILSGVISRLDRNAPEYDGGYNDFNTNYIQASAAASGGSSGSPVINLAGHVVALQAGGRLDHATTDYFLPLDRPLRALRCMQEGQVITRGTIQTQWVLKPYDECRRLGLTPEWEAKIRAAAPKETTNILAAEVVLPNGPGDEKIKEGDVLIKVNGEFLTSFIKLSAILDSSVGGTVTLLMQRGGKDHEVTLDVGDLHAITPDRFLTVGGSTFHDLSYQLARIHAVAAKGVYVCESAGSFKLDGCISGWIVESVDNRPTPNLDAFIEVLESIPDKSRVVVSYHHLSDLHTRGTSIVYIDRHWHPKMRLAVRNDKTGLWDFSDIGHAKPADPPVARSADFIELDGVSHPAAAEIVRSFVRVSCSMPCKLDGFPQARKTGFGLVVDAEKGLVLLSRAIVPYDLCDISITVADSIIVEGEVIFLHPIQNWVIVKYDPKLVQAPVQSAPLSDKMPKLGEDIIFVGFNHNWRLVMAKTTVTDITAVTIPVNMSAPRYRAINVDSITVDTGLAGQCSNGVLIGGDGKIQGLWLNYLGERSRSSKDIEYHLGLPVPAFMPVLNKILRGETPELRILNMESYVIHMSQARIMGVSEAWIKKVCEANKGRHQLFMVRKIDCPPIGSKPSDDNLQEGDIILTLNGKLITRVSEFDIMYDQAALDMLIVRKGQEKTLRVPTTPTAHIQTARALIFCGAVLHQPHHAVRQQISKLHSEIYVAARSRGSPAAQYGLGPTNFVTAVNGIETHTLDDFVREVDKIPDNTYFRLRAVTFENVPWVVTMKKNDHYFPMSEYVKTSPATGSPWKVVSYSDRKPTDGKNENTHPDPPVAENMDAEPVENGSGVEEEAVAKETTADVAVDGGSVADGKANSSSTA